MKCSVDGCTKETKAIGLCNMHYERRRKHGDVHTVKTTRGRPATNRIHGPFCIVDGCGRPHKARGYCAMHYRRLMRHGDIDATETNRNHDGKCSVEGCLEPYSARGFCANHYSRWRETGDPLYVPRVPGEKKWINNRGYVYVQKPGHPNSQKSSGSILEHRLVMAEKLGRPLFDDEHVHHINGNRTDNRSENLELWLRRQPPGQRVRDLLAWAHEIIDRYEGKLFANLQESSTDRDSD